MCDLTFICNVRTSQSIVTSDHYARNIGSFKVLNCIKSFFLKFVFENLKAIKGKITLSIDSLNIFWIFINLFRANSKYSKSPWCILFKCLMIRIRNGVFIHDLKHNFGRSFTITIITFLCHWIRSNNTHSLDIRIKLEPSITNTLMISFAIKWK